MNTWILIALALLATAFSRPVNATEPLTASDRESLAALAQDQAQGATLRRADAAFEAGHWSEAAAVFGSLPTDNEEAARYPLLRRCQALTEQGGRSEALAACDALLHSVIPDAADLQAKVAALMLGTGRPSDGDLRMAKVLLDKVDGLDPDSVWSEAARCNVAQRIGDRSLLGACSARLSQLAPGSRLARPYAQAAGGRGRNLFKFGFLGLLLAAALFTLAHRLLGRRAALVASAALLLLAWPGAAQAQDQPAISTESSAAPAAVDNGPGDTAQGIEQDMQLLQDLSEKVATAEQLITAKNDWREAANKYVEILTIAPYFVKGWRRLCEAYSHLGQPVEGAHACRQVLESKEGNAWDRAMLVHHLLSGPEGTSQKVRAEAKELANAAVALEPKERWGYDAQCELALVTDDQNALKRCSEQLDRLAPDDRKTVALLFALALREHRAADAEKVIERARAGGIDAPTLARMRQSLDAQRPLVSRLWRSAPLGLGLGALATVLVLLGRYLLNLRARARVRGFGESRL